MGTSEPERGPASTGTEFDDIPLPVPLDADRVVRGEAVYSEYCAACHGADLAGAPDWKIPNPDGTFKPPPQNSSGHTWHHTDSLLLGLVRDGLDDPISRMPAFGDRLTDDEIIAVLDFIKSRWGDQERVYQWRATWVAREREKERTQGSG